MICGDYDPCEHCTESYPECGFEPEDCIEDAIENQYEGLREL